MHNLAVLAAKTEEILQRDGWNKGFLTYPSPVPGKATHCVGGALNIAMSGEDSWQTGNPDAQAVYREFAAIINANPDWSQRVSLSVLATADSPYATIHTIASWNNHGATTREDISAVLNALAEKELASVG